MYNVEYITLFLSIIWTGVLYLMFLLRMMDDYFIRNAI